MLNRSKQVVNCLTFYEPIEKQIKDYEPELNQSFKSSKLKKSGKLKLPSRSSAGDYTKIVTFKSISFRYAPTPNYFDILKFTYDFQANLEQICYELNEHKQ